MITMSGLLSYKHSLKWSYCIDSSYYLKKNTNSIYIQLNGIQTRFVFIVFYLHLI